MTPFHKIKIVKTLRPKIKIIHRIDGAAQDYGRGIEWDFLQKKVNRIVDLTIFQSKYGRFATREKYSVIGNDGPVINNPVDTILFRPCQKNFSKSIRPKVAYISFSTNPRKGGDQVLEVAKKNKDIDFILIGRFENHQDLNLENIHFTGHLTRDEVAETLGACHFFLFFSQNEACPNVVLEAMASGLPVLYLDSGGTPELVGAADLTITVETFREKINTIWPNWNEWSTRVRKRAEEMFSVDRIIPEYLKAMMKVRSS